MFKYETERFGFSKYSFVFKWPSNESYWMQVLGGPSRLVLIDLASVRLA